MAPATDDLIARVAAVLSDARVEIGPREARWIVEEASDAATALEFARRRAGGEPLQYILGAAHFRHLRLVVDEHVLIPRPETEILVEHALERLPRAGRIVDIGTGSGAIALSIAYERPDAVVAATDVSGPALTCARRNADIIGVGVDLYAGDLFAALPDELRGALDVVVANPPYVAESDRGLLSLDVAEHEPDVALFGGGDGLDVTRRLVRDAREWLVPEGWLILEIADGSGARVTALLERAGYRDVVFHPDLSGRDRIAEGHT